MPPMSTLCSMPLLTRPKSVPDKIPTFRSETDFRRFRSCVQQKKRECFPLTFFLVPFIKADSQQPFTFHRSPFKKSKIVFNHQAEAVVYDLVKVVVVRDRAVRQKVTITHSSKFVLHTDVESLGIETH